MHLEIHLDQTNLKPGYACPLISSIVVSGFKSNAFLGASAVGPSSVYFATILTRQYTNSTNEEKVSIAVIPQKSKVIVAVTV
jgi:hypothetical protein